MLGLAPLRGGADDETGAHGRRGARGWARGRQSRGALEVFEVFASGSLTDEVYILEDVAGKRIAIAPASLKEKYRRR